MYLLDRVPSWLNQDSVSFQVFWYRVRQALRL
jgi:hypothetical protein